MEGYKLWKSKAEGNSACDYAFHMGVTRFEDFRDRLGSVVNLNDHRERTANARWPGWFLSCLSAPGLFTPCRELAPGGAYDQNPSQA